MVRHIEPSLCIDGRLLLVLGSITQAFAHVGDVAVITPLRRHVQDCIVVDLQLAAPKCASDGLLSLPSLPHFFGLQQSGGKEEKPVFTPSDPSEHERKS